MLPVICWMLKGYKKGIRHKDVSGFSVVCALMFISWPAFQHKADTGKNKSWLHERFTLLWAESPKKCLAWKWRRRRRKTMKIWFWQTREPQVRPATHIHRHTHLPQTHNILKNMMSCCRWPYINIYKTYKHLSDINAKFHKTNKYLKIVERRTFHAHFLLEIRNPEPVWS